MQKGASESGSALVRTDKDKCGGEREVCCEGSRGTGNSPPCTAGEGPECGWVGMRGGSL